MIVKMLTQTKIVKKSFLKTTYYTLNHILSKKAEINRHLRADWLSFICLGKRLDFLEPAQFTPLWSGNFRCDLNLLLFNQVNDYFLDFIIDETGEKFHNFRRQNILLRCFRLAGATKTTVRFEEILRILHQNFFFRID